MQFLLVEMLDMARLKRMTGGSLEVVELPIGKTTIGRAPQCDLNLMSPVVSKHHAVVECNKEFCMLKNESSKGTRINGRTVRDPIRLQHGDQIQVGMEILVFLQPESVGERSDSERFKLTREHTPDPEDSIRHLVARPGLAVSNEDLSDTFRIHSDKIRGRIALREQSLASLATTDSVRKLSQLLRLTDVIRSCGPGNNVRFIFEAMYQFFPCATQIVLAEQNIDRRSSFHVSAAHCADGQESALICEDVIHQVARQNECLLLSDQWRETPVDKPKLSTMGRVSLMCVPLRDTDGSCCAVIQMLAGVPGDEFDVADLERLAILAQLLTMALPLRDAR